MIIYMYIIIKIILDNNMLSEISRIEPPKKKHKNKKHQKAAPKKNTPSWKAPSPDKQMWLQQGVETYFEERGWKTLTVVVVIFFRFLGDSSKGAISSPNWFGVISRAFMTNL